MFSVSLTSSDPAIEVATNQAQVVITSDDGNIKIVLEKGACSINVGFQ